MERSLSCQSIASSDVTSLSQKKNGRLFNLPQVIESNGEPSRARTCDPLIKSAFTDTPAGYGSYDLLTFVTGCSRQRVYLLLPSISSLSVFLSQVCLNCLPLNKQRILSPNSRTSPSLTKHDKPILSRMVSRQSQLHSVRFKMESRHFHVIGQRILIRFGRTCLMLVAWSRNVLFGRQRKRHQTCRIFPSS